MYPQVNSSFYFDPVPEGTSSNISKASLAASNKELRIGSFRGVYYPMSHRPASHSEIQTINGKNYLVINCGTATTNFGDGQIWFDITGIWEESS
jgi:hypothetical protein